MDGRRRGDGTAAAGPPGAARSRSQPGTHRRRRRNSRVQVHMAGWPPPVKKAGGRRQVRCHLRLPGVEPGSSSSGCWPVRRTGQRTSSSRPSSGRQPPDAASPRAERSRPRRRPASRGRGRLPEGREAPVARRLAEAQHATTRMRSPTSAVRPLAQPRPYHLCPDRGRGRCARGPRASGSRRSCQRPRRRPGRGLERRQQRGDASAAHAHHGVAPGAEMPCQRSRLPGAQLPPGSWPRGDALGAARPEEVEGGHMYVRPKWASSPARLADEAVLPGRSSSRPRPGDRLRDRRAGDPARRTSRRARPSA